MSGDKFKVGERIFAKTKGYPTWPAVVTERLPGKVETYIVLYYGTYESSKVKVDSMFAYDEANIARFSKGSKSQGFITGMEEIENNKDITEKSKAGDDLNETENQEKNNKSDGDEEEGELMIDEDGPPVLQRETKLTNFTPVAPSRTKRTGSFSKKDSKVPITSESAPSPQTLISDEKPDSPAPNASKKTPVIPPNKRGSRGIVKKESSIPSPVPITTPISSDSPQPEIVSRSGRKIKPKRFADDEIGTNNATIVGTTTSKASPTTEESPTSFEPPAKRPKRVSMPSFKAQAAKIEKEKAAAVVEKTPPVPEKPKSSQQGRNSKKIESGPNSSTTPTSLPRPPPLKAMPGLVQAPPEKATKIEKKKGPPPLVPIFTNNETGKSSGENVDEKKEEGEIFDDKNSDEILRGLGLVSQKNEEEKKGKVGEENGGENLEIVKEEMIDGSSGGDKKEEENEEKIITVGKDEERRTQTLEKLSSDDDVEKFRIPTKVQVEIPIGEVKAKVSLGFNYTRPTKFKSVKSRYKYDTNTAKSVLKTKAHLERNPVSTLHAIYMSSKSAQQSESTEFSSIVTRIDRLHQKHKQLKMEGEMVEIIGQLIECLNINSGDCDKAIELLDRLGSYEVNTLALKKNPDVVEIIRKLQKYTCKFEDWKVDLTENQKRLILGKARIINEKAAKIYQSFKLLFIAVPGKTFIEGFHDEVDKFLLKTKDLHPEAFLGLYSESQLDNYNGMSEEGEFADKENAELTKEEEEERGSSTGFYDDDEIDDINGYEIDHVLGNNEEPYSPPPSPQNMTTQNGEEVEEEVNNEEKISNNITNNEENLSSIEIDTDTTTNPITTANDNENNESLDLLECNNENIGKSEEENEEEKMDVLESSEHNEMEIEGGEEEGELANDEDEDEVVEAQEKNLTDDVLATLES